jgi:hypothetical protein
MLTGDGRSPTSRVAGEWKRELTQQEMCKIRVLIKSSRRLHSAFSWTSCRRKNCKGLSMLYCTSSIS